MTTMSTVELDLWKNYCGYVQSVPSSSRMKQRTFEMECAVKLGNNKSQSRSRNRACYVGLRLVKKIYSPDNKSDEPIESTKSTKSILASVPNSLAPLLAFAISL